MKESDNFKKIFCYSPIEKDDLLVLEEPDKKAKIKFFNIRGEGVHFVSIDEHFSDKVGDLFKKGSCCTRNADYTVMFEDVKGKHILFLELKSSCGGVFKSAYQQSLSTYMKVCMILSICEGFDIDDYSIDFLFTAKKGAELEMMKNELEELEPRNQFDEFVLSLLNGEKIKFCVNSINRNLTFIHSNYTSKEITCQLLTTETDYVDYDVCSH